MTEQIKHLENCLDSMLKAALAAEAKEYNQRLIEEAKNTDDEIPEKTDEKCLALIGGNPRSLSAKRVLRVMLAAVVTVSLLITMSYAVYRGAKARETEIIASISHTGKDTTVTYTEEPVPANPSDSIKFTYIPEGFTLFHTNRSSVSYAGTDGQLFNASKHKMGQAGFVNWDTEDADVRPTIINGCEGYITKEMNARSGKLSIIWVWFDYEERFIYHAMTIGFPEEEMYKVFDGLTFE